MAYTRRGELFEKRFLQRLAKNEDLSTITERAIREAKKSKLLKLFVEKQTVEISFSPVVYSSRDKNHIKQFVMSERERRDYTINLYWFTPYQSYI